MGTDHRIGSRIHWLDDQSSYSFHASVSLSVRLFVYITVCSRPQFLTFKKNDISFVVPRTSHFQLCFEKQNFCPKIEEKKQSPFILCKNKSAVFSLSDSALVLYEWKALVCSELSSGSHQPQKKSQSKQISFETE